MKSRYVSIFIFFALGIILTYLTNMLISAVIFVLVIVLFGALHMLRGFHSVFYIFLTLCFAAGSLLFSFANYAPNTYNNEYVTIYGRISELPFSYDGESYYYIVKPKTLTYMKNEITFTKSVRVCSENVYSYGDCIKVSGFLNEFDERMNDSGFNSKMYYKSRGVFYKMYDIESCLSQHYNAYSAHDILLSVQNMCARYIDSWYLGNANAYLKAFIIGETRGFDDDIKDLLTRSGMRRFLYAPFIHICIILSLLGFIFIIFKTKRYARDTISAAVLLLYCAFSSTRPIFLKSLFAASFILLYKKKFGYLHTLDAFASAGMFTLLFNPLFLFDAGFIMSILFSTLYTMFGKRAANLLSFTGIFRYPLAIWIIGIVGLMPVYAFFFHGAPVLMPIVTIIAFPLTIMIIAVFWISMTLHTVFSFDFVSNTFLSSLLAMFDFAARFIGSSAISYITAASPTAKQIALFYCAVILSYLSLLKRRNSDLILFLSTVCICLAGVVSFEYISDISKVKIMFVNVGQGDGAVVSVGYREKLLIDGGGSAVYSDFNLGRYIYVPFLQSRGIRKADAIVTHYHKDHCQGIEAAIKQIKIRTLFVPDCEPDNELRIQLLKTAAEYGTKVEFVKQGDKITFPSGLTVEFISPDSKDLQSSDSNETSLVAYVSFGRFCTLFTGDTTKNQETKMLGRGLVRKCDVLKIAHHGSDTSSSDDFIAAATPSCAVISVGENNNYALPDPEVVERLRETTVMRTDVNGNITVTGDKNGLVSVKSYKGNVIYRK